MASLQRTDDIEFYLKNFNILQFVDSIKVCPKVWYQNRVGKDDHWGVYLKLETSIEPDSYFLLLKFLSHKQLGEVWSDSGYASGRTIAKDIENEGMIKEWALAKKIQGEICYNILENYSFNKHKEILFSINNLTEIELKELGKLYLVNDIDHVTIYASNNRCVACSKTNTILIENLSLNGIIGLVQKGFLQEYIYQYVKNEDYSNKLTYSEFKEFAKKTFST